MNELETALNYSEGVKEGRIVVNKYVKLAIERHFNDLRASKTKDFPYYFCVDHAQKALSFFDFLHLTKGVSPETANPDHVKDGKVVFVLQPWQSFLVSSLFGWVRKENGNRRFTEAYIEIPKKNAKTTTAAAIGNFMLIGDGETGPEVYHAAFTRDQASICFDEAVAQIKSSPDLSRQVTILNHNVSSIRTRAKMSAVSHDANNTEGKNAHCAIVDEYHVHRSDNVKDSLQSGQAAREQPLLFAITTAGYNKQGPCYLHRQLCIGMLEGRYPLDNIFVLIYGLDEDDDWKDSTNWKKANPSWGVSVDADFLQSQFDKAVLGGTKEVDFKTKHLNMWVDAARTWIASETVNATAKPDFTPPEGSECYMGLDLGMSNDLSALSLYFPKYKHFIRRIYVPQAAKEKVQGGVAYDQWIRDGWMTVAGELTTDYDYIYEDILELASRYELLFGGYDPYNANQLMTKLNEVFPSRYMADKDKKGKFNYEPRFQAMRQGFLTMSAPTRQYEEMLLNKEFTHDGSPVMAWMLGNTVIKRDAAGGMKPDKDKSSDKIDGVVADIIAFNHFLEWDERFQKKSEINVW